MLTLTLMKHTEYYLNTHTITNCFCFFTTATLIHATETLSHIRLEHSHDYYLIFCAQMKRKHDRNAVRHFIYFHSYKLRKHNHSSLKCSHILLKHNIETFFKTTEMLSWLQRKHSYILKCCHTHVYYWKSHTQL